MWLHLDLIGKVMTDCGKLFPTIEYAFTTIPTYPSGQIGFFLMSNDESETAMLAPKHEPDAATQVRATCECGALLAGCATCALLAGCAGCAIGGGDGGDVSVVVVVLVWWWR